MILSVLLAAGDLSCPNDSNLGPILHRFCDTATYWLKIVNFHTPLPFNAIARSIS